MHDLNQTWRNACQTWMIVSEHASRAGFLLGLRVAASFQVHGTREIVDGCFFSFNALCHEHKQPMTVFTNKCGGLTCVSVPFTE